MNESWAGCGAWLATVRLYGAHLAGVRFLRYGLVGGSGAIANMAILYLLVGYFGWPHFGAACASGEATICLNFALNDAWTFGDVINKPTWRGRIMWYHGSALTGFCTTLAALLLLTHVVGISYLAANLVGIAAGTVVNYRANLRFTWRRTDVAVLVPNLALREEV